MPFNIPTTRQLIRSGVQDLEIELGQSLPIVGVERALNISFSGALRDLYDYQMWITRQIIPSDKSDEETIVDTARNEGVIRKNADYAKGFVVFSGSGDIPNDTAMQSLDGVVFHVTATESNVNNQIKVSVKANDAGVTGNLPDGEALTLISPLPGVNSVGVIYNGISGGADIEPVSELLERLLFRKRNPPVGGALHDYIIWAREMTGVSRAWAWDGWHGPGTVGLAWVYDSRDDITPTLTDKEDMEEHLFRHVDPATGNYVGKPAGIEVWAVAIILKPVNMEIKLIPDGIATRASVNSNLLELQKTLSPGQKLTLSSVRTAIGTATNVTDYSLNLSSDIQAQPNELITIGAITWLTA
ncbi:baseplate J/gp47 family protein [Pectobacterium aroidearum]|uniref:baseplate J/gp47 family protein n=1 Tax=Pectobacterium aroidearum TaxID=1201031 RepID=UPI0015EFF1D6|nr:baseplate J/gp47 family protein [Pectobacterium aroidearum]MBA5235295.1 baseplate J/gp47 family protein [Pectobacterium aroidearum]